MLSKSSVVALGMGAVLASAAAVFFRRRRARKGAVVLETCTAPVNIAVIKYWGKRDETLILPQNDSLSGTLSQDSMCSTTTVMASKSFTEDELWLNNKKEPISGRIAACLKAIRAQAEDRVDDKGNVIVKKEDWAQYKVRIVSINNFPTAAGLASSASGLCCLAYALGKVFAPSMCGTDRAAISRIARLGSGSACRSMYGGFVRWNQGARSDGIDSIAEQVVDEKHWPLSIIVLVVNDARKETSSTAGMQQTVETSPDFPGRLQRVPPRMARIQDAIRNRDFPVFGQITMDDSDDFHQCCATTTPAIFYLNDVSRRVQSLVREYNKKAGQIQVAYTFDAGPNAVLYLEKKHVPEVLALVNRYFPSTTLKGEQYFHNYSQPVSTTLPEKLSALQEVQADKLKYVIVTEVGGGPRTLGLKDSLIDPNTGLRKSA